MVKGKPSQLPLGDTIDKALVGLGSADNTADLDKPVSTLTAAAILAAARGFKSAAQDVSASASLTSVGVCFRVITAGVTLTLPTLASNTQGAALIIRNETTGSVVVQETVGRIYTSAGASSSILTLAPNEWVELLVSGANWIADARGKLSEVLALAGGSMTGAVNLAPPVVVANSATPGIGAAASNNISLSGATTITGFDTIAAGACRLVKFGSSRTLTHDATKLILPGSANITTAVNDIAMFRSLGSGNWECVFYTKANGQAVVSSGGASNSLSFVKIAASAIGQASFAVPGGYTPGAVLVSLSGSLLDGSEYTATDGVNIVLNSGVKTVYDFLLVGALTSSTVTDPTKLPLAGGFMSGAINFSVPVSLADSATPAIGATASNSVTLNGTTTVTGFDTIAAGATRILKFMGVRVLTYDATKLILPTAANITTAVGDVAMFRSLGSGNWECIFYQRANGQPLMGGGNPVQKTGDTMSGALNWAPPVSLDDSATPAIGAAASNSATLAGATAITGFDTAPSGAIRLVKFTGVRVLTHDPVKLILPGAVNIGTAVGDIAGFRSLGSGNWECFLYTRADGRALVGITEARMAAAELSVKQQPKYNLMPDSGRFAGRIDPMALQSSSGTFTATSFFTAYDGTTVANAGAFYHDNSTNGGAASAINADVQALLAAMGRTAGNARYGVEFFLAAYTSRSTAGTLPATGTDGVTRYLATVTNSKAMFSVVQSCTFCAWVRVTSGSMHINASSYYKNGVLVTGGTPILVSENWVHVRVVSVAAIGYDNGYPYIYMTSAARMLMACPIFLPGVADMGLHMAPLATLNAALSAI